MLLSMLIGIGASIATEVITWINKQVNNTVLKGDGAFLFAAAISLVAAGIQIYLVPVASFQAFLSQATVVWASSQGFFLIVIQLFGLDVSSTTTTAATPSAPPALG